MKNPVTTKKAYGIDLETIVVFAFAAAIGAVGAFYSRQRLDSQNRVYLPVVQMNDNPLAIATPTPVISLPQVSSQSSPDGTKLLTMTNTTNNDFSKTYSFVSSDPDGSNKQTVYAATYSASISGTMAIPFNTWSPDDRYVFVTQTTPSGTQAVVARADGQSIDDSEQTVNATSLYNLQNTGNTYQETTGWASDTLLIMNTTASDGSKSTSYWFEVPSKSIIPLSTQF